MVSTGDLRKITGITTAQISDSELSGIITMSDKQVDNEPEVELSTAERDIASAYLAAATALRRLSQEALISSGSYSLGRLRVDNKSTSTARLSLADSFEKKYREIIGLATGGEGIRRIWTYP